MMKDSRNNKNKKGIIILGGLSLLGVLGGTLAYFTTTTNIANKFKSGMYQNEIVEKFESPANWTPGTITEKKISVKNTGNIPMAVRASYTEKWVSASGKELNLKDIDNNQVSIINFGKNWTKSSDGYYYYGSKENKTVLEPTSVSTSFINSVKFNEKVNASLKESVSEDGKTITYTSTGDGYDNATYTLMVKIETVQHDAANNFWK